MSKISIVMLLLLTGCNAFIKNAEQIKHIGHDVVDEEIDEAINQEKSKEKDES